MRTWTPKEVVAYIRDAGFEDMRGLSLECLTTLETNTVVESTDDSPVEVTATRKKRTRRTPQCPLGSMQPGGDLFNSIKKSFYSFPVGSPVTIKDVAAHSGHPMQRCRAVEKYLTVEGLCRRQGHSLTMIG